MVGNEVIVYRGMGRKSTYSNIDSVTVRGCRVCLKGEGIFETVFFPIGFNILLKGKVNELLIPSNEDQRRKIKRVIGCSKARSIEINGVLPRLSFKDNCTNIGVSFENNSDLLRAYLNKNIKEKVIFAKYIIDATEIYEGYINSISKETTLSEIKKPVEDMLDLLSQAEATFVSCYFTPSLIPVISSLNNILSKCKSNPSKKASSVWYSNMKVKYYLGKIFNNVHFRNIFRAYAISSRG